jgi:outer membrane protein OmpA-like peptidoglycan-associated protein
LPGVADIEEWSVYRFHLLVTVRVPRRAHLAHFAPALGVLMLILAGCVKPRPEAPPNPDLAAAVEYLTDDLAAQLGPRPPGSGVLVIDPILDRATGQQTGASQRLEEELGRALTEAVPQLELTAFDGEGVARSRLVLTGTVASLDAPDAYSANVALTDRESGLVVAQSAVRFAEEDLDRAPTRFYDDSPSLVRDRSVDGYLRTAETPAGEMADALYVEQIPTGALLAQALEAYNAERWEEALEAYSAAAARTDGQQLRTFNGLYLTNLRLDRMGAAEEAFGRIVDLGLATNNLSVKLLFRPGSTEFWPSPELSGMYPMWLRRIAGAVQTSGNCLEVLGHTSRSGSEAVNDRLSLARAEAVRGLLNEHAAGNVAGQLSARGMGFRDNIIGTGADDASDAIDRRVEFNVIPCERGGA